MVVGLGNPGKKYAETRHNAGFRVIDALAKTLKTEVRKKRFGALFGEGEFACKKLILLKPLQFMNRSGQPVATAVGFYKLAPQNLLVIIDDMALPPGKIRLKSKGSAGGHNGLADIIEKLGTNNFGRLRIGIGAAERIDSADFVLGKPTEQQRLLLDEAAEKAQKATLCWIEHGIQAAMNEFN